LSVAAVVVGLVEMVAAEAPEPSSIQTLEYQSQVVRQYRQQSVAEEQQELLTAITPIKPLGDQVVMDKIQL
jgi:hypothetical protein